MKRLFLLLLIVMLLVGCTAPTPPFEENPPPPPPVPNETTLTFCENFAVRGTYAVQLTAALEAAGIPTGGEDADKIIYAGEDENAPAAAKANATARAANYNDFSIVCDGESLALYGGSEHATSEAIAYLLATFQANGGITVNKDLSYTNAPALLDVTVAGHPLSEITVVYTDDTCRGVAAEMAHAISRACGYPIPYAEQASGPVITLTAENATAETFFSYDYSWSADEKGITLTAKTRASLSFAAQDLVACLADRNTFPVGEKEERTCSVKQAKASDTALFKYCGMWQATDKEHPDTMVSYWSTAYVEIDFTGNAIAVDFSAPVPYDYSLDGGAYSEEQPAISRAVIYAEGEGKHTLRIRKKAGRSVHMHFAGVTVPATATLSRTADRAHYVQFVGDSISDGMNTFSHRVGEVLGWDYAVTACAGLALQDNKGWWYVNNGKHEAGTMSARLRDNFGIQTIGMESAFFKLGLAENNMTGEERELYADHYYDEAGTLECDFSSGNAPDIVFIFLGTNDQIKYENTVATHFVNTYVRFARRILDTYGEDTQICIMNALTHSVPPEKNDENNGIYVSIREAAVAIAGEFPDNIHFIDREDIISWNVEIGSDNCHPTGAGQATLTEKVGAFLQDVYG